MTNWYRYSQKCLLSLFRIKVNISLNVLKMVHNSPTSRTLSWNLRCGPWRLHTVAVWLDFMMTSSNGNILRVTGPMCGKFTGHRWISFTKGQWRGALIFSLICAWTNRWANNRDAGDLSRHRAHYYVIVMVMVCFVSLWFASPVHLYPLEPPSVFIVESWGPKIYEKSFLIYPPNSRW